MKKFLSLTAKILGSLVLFGLVGLFALGYYFNTDRMKPVLENYVKNHYQRSLSIGDISWKLFPKAGLSLSNLSLGNPSGFGDKPFAQLKNLNIYVETMKLFSGKIEVESLELKEPSAHLVVNSQGANNWSDLTTQPNSASAAQSASEASSLAEKADFSAFTFNIEKIEIVDGAFTYQDQKTGEKFDVKNVMLSSQDVALGKDFPVNLSLHVVSNAPVLDTQITAKGKLRLPEKGPYDIKTLSLQGDISLSTLGVNGLQISRLQSPVTLQNSVIHLSQLSADFYGGSVRGDIRINAQSEPAEVQANYDIKGSDITTMLRDLGQKQTFSGKLNMKGNLRFKAHPEKKQLTSSLTGAAAMNINQGALHGVDLVYWYQTGMNLMKTKDPTALALGAVSAIAGGGAAGGNTGKTQFQGTHANLKLNQGSLSTQDLHVYNQYVYGLGAGVIHLASETIDFRFNISGASQKNGGVQPTGQVIPLTIKGSLNDPKMKVDVTPVVGGILQNVIPQKEGKTRPAGQAPAEAILQQIFQR